MISSQKIPAGQLDVTGGGYTDEQAQDAVGTILTDTSEIDFTYDDSTPEITATLRNNSIGNARLEHISANHIKGRLSGNGVVQDIPMSDLPISTSTQTALNLKSDKAIEMSLASDYTLSSTTADQKLFNVGASGNGAFQVLANKTYEITGYVSLTDLSATSSNFSLAFLGTAVASAVNINTIASKATFISGAQFVGVMNSFSAYQLIINSVSSTAYIRFFGEIRFSTGGTLIPAIRNSVAVAGIVKTGSSVMIREKGSDTFTHTINVD